MRMTAIRMAAVGLALLLAAAAGPASASSFCGVKATRDGFVALRAGPAATARLVGRMRAGDEVMLEQGSRGDWIELRWWRGGDRLSKGFDRHSGRGWAHRRLIAEDCG